jgi:hypothetical protein
MPVSLEPDQKLPIVLDCDLDKPLDSRPTFFFPSVSMRKYSSLSGEVDAAMEHKKADDIFAANCELFNKHCVGWRNMGGMEFGKSDIQDFLTHQEVRELLRKFLGNQHVSLDEKKSSV